MSPIAKVRTPDLWLPPDTTAQHGWLRQESSLRPAVIPLDGTSSRFDHLDLAYCRATMAHRDFDFFVNFAGRDTLGFTEDDLEVFYPTED